jgi:hypothetical protein
MVGEVVVVVLVVEVSEEVVQGIGLLRTTERGLVALIFEVEDGENRLPYVTYVHSQDKSRVLLYVMRTTLFFPFVLEVKVFSLYENYIMMLYKVSFSHGVFFL